VHTAWRARDARVTEPYESDHGFSLIELIVSFALFSILVAAAVPHLRGFGYDIWSAHAQLMADLRQARADAITRGDHFAVAVVSSTAYEIRRLSDPNNDGIWTLKGTATVRALPAGVTFTGGVGGLFEFNTRGLLVTPEAADALVLEDEDSGNARTVTVWPSGQVAPVEIPS
jgi:prepilin-type N-terminal cleavage/methylation domain-containing protein